MREANGPGMSSAAAPEPVAHGDANAAHLAHLFDYCRALLGGEAGAADTARSVMASAHSVLSGTDRRAWLLALARRQAIALVQLANTEPSYAVPAPAVTTGQQVAVLSAFRALTDSDREILDLVYRHGIRPAELGAVLSIPAGEAYRRLINAEEKFIHTAAVPGIRTGPGLDEITSLPLATPPTPEGDDRWLSPGRVRGNSDRVTSRRAVVRRGLQLATAAAVALGGLTWAVMHFAGPDHGHGPDRAAIVPGGEANPSGQLSAAPHPTATGQPKKSGAPAIPISALLPVSGQSTTQGVNPPPPFVMPSPTPTTAPVTTPPPTTPPPTTPPPTTPPPTTPPPTTPPPTTPPPTSPPPPSPG